MKSVFWGRLVQREFVPRSVVSCPITLSPSTLLFPIYEKCIVLLYVFGRVLRKRHLFKVILDLLWVYDLCLWQVLLELSFSLECSVDCTLIRTVSLENFDSFWGQLVQSANEFLMCFFIVSRPDSFKLPRLRIFWSWRNRTALFPTFSIATWRRFPRNIRWETRAV